MFVRPVVNLRSKSAVTAVLKLPVAKKTLTRACIFLFLWEGKQEPFKACRCFGLQMATGSGT